MMRSLSASYPWTSSPFIANAPMAGFAGGALAAAVSNAGGLGFIGARFDFDYLTSQLEQASSLLQETQTSESSNRHLGLGVGFLCFGVKADEAVAALRKYRPAAVWLAAATDLADYATWTQKLRATADESDTKPPAVWIQVGSVATALTVAQTAKPDVIVMQGIDAGGHGFEAGAGVISLVPEAADALHAAGFGDIPLVAAGGIVDGRGVAAALALGARGVVMGTRFLASKEIIVPHPGYQAAVLAAHDGGQSTVRAKIFDELKGPNMWPALYDGRGIKNASYNDFTRGTTLEDIRQLHADASNLDDMGFVKDAEERRVTVWSGTGVGLVKEVRGAGEIVESIRHQARVAMAKAMEHFNE